MIKRFFPEDSNQFDFLQKIFKSFDKEFIDRLEMFFPMWCVLSFKHYLIKSYDIYVIFNPIDIENNEKYVFSLSSYDWFGVISIILHTIFLLHLMKKFDYFGPFRTVKSDFQTNFLLFVSLFSLFNVFIHGKLMIGLFLLNVVLYIIYRSNSYFSISLGLFLSILTLFLSLRFNEPVLATSAAIFLPFLVSSLLFKSRNQIVYAQKYLPLIIFIFISSKELWFGFIGLSYFLFFNMYYYFSFKRKYDFLRFDQA